MTNKYGETLNGKITIYKVVNALYNYYLSKDSTHIDAPESAKKLFADSPYCQICTGKIFKVSEYGTLVSDLWNKFDNERKFYQLCEWKSRAVEEICEYFLSKYKEVKSYCTDDSGNSILVYIDYADDMYKVMNKIKLDLARYDVNCAVTDEYIKIYLPHCYFSETMFFFNKKDETPEGMNYNDLDILESINHIKKYLGHIGAEMKTSGVFYLVTRLSTFDRVAKYFSSNTKYMLELINSNEDTNGVVPIKITIDENSKKNENADKAKFLCDFVDELIDKLGEKDVRLIPHKYYTKDQKDFITNALGVPSIMIKDTTKSEYKDAFLIVPSDREKYIKKCDNILQSLGYSYKKLSDYFIEQMYY